MATTTIPAFPALTRPPHEEYAALAFKSAGVGTVAIIPVVLVTAILMAAADRRWQAELTMPMAALWLASAWVLLKVVGMLGKASAALGWQLEQVGEWNETQNEIALARVKLEVNVSGVGNKVFVNQSTTTAQLAALNAQGIPETSGAFMSHVSQFYSRAINGGLERRYWLAGDGARESHRFTDGALLTRPEYEQIVTTLEQLGKIEGRRQGSAGRLVKPSPALLSRAKSGQ